MAKNLIILVAFLLMLPLASNAETIYVTDSLKLKLRTTASDNAEVITSLDSGQKLTLVEKQRRFTKVKTEKGEQGWVQSWFLTDKPPATYIVDSVTKENEVLVKKLAAANTKLNNFDSETSRENEELKGSVKALSNKIETLTTTRNQLEETIDHQESKLAKYEFAEQYNINLLITIFFVFSFVTGFICSRIWSNLQERKRLWGYQLAH